MTVNFEDIGWGEYVVQPPSFEANYCSGTCSFQLDKVSSNPYVPNVSCTPDKFDSQTILYFHDNNLILRTFPKMIVTSCGCS
uniref:TGF_BETA_2 domain-containing protein n=1 Tax=Syphacia muris TaxID=451379 RepID=A0A0N5AAI0_9BILA